MLKTFAARPNLRVSSSRSAHHLRKPLTFPPFLRRSLPAGKSAMASEGPSTGEPRAPSPSAQGPVAKKPRLDAPAKPSSSPIPPKTPKLSRAQQKKAQYDALPEACSSDDVLWQEIKEILGTEYVENALAEGTDRKSPFAYHDEVEAEVLALSSNGTALATSSSSSRPWVIVVPFALPGETVRLKVFRNARMHSQADLLEVLTPNADLRDASRVQCKYFGTCGGCQYQMLSYEKQLDLKRDVVVKAYKTYSKLPESALPSIESTMPSPKQFEYRTKITPHFEAPNKAQRKDPNNPKNDTERPSWFNIGFNSVGSHKVMDIEDCPIATPIIRETLPDVRANAIKKLYTYKKGVSLILRDSLSLVPTTSTSTDSKTEPGAELDNASATETANEKNICVTDHRGTIRERVGPWLFEYPASSFFQNNNAVLPSLTEYVRARIFADSEPSDSARPRATHLVDAYCGAGLFAITLSPSFTRVAGIELSAESIRAATRNAHVLNAVPKEKITFRAGDAKDIFAVVRNDFPANETVLIIDPPRKGCDEAFVKQLLEFGARTVVYVSCNVHTQARDVGMILRGVVEGKERKRRYGLESLRGFDLFPQTAHVESVAVLRLVPEDGERSSEAAAAVMNVNDA